MTEPERREPPGTHRLEHDRAEGLEAATIRSYTFRQPEYQDQVVSS